MEYQSKKFIITGLPRSRTAWMAALFNTHEDIMCFHEPINQFRSLDEMKVHIDSVDKKYVGISDSSVGAYSDFYIKNFDCPIVIVNRNKAAALESYCDFLGFEKEQAEYVFGLVKKGLSDIKRDKDALEIEFTSLNNPVVIKDIWEYCVPDIKFDEEKAKILQGLTVIQNVYNILNENKINFDYPKLT